MEDSPWPADFPRIPEEPWVHAAVDPMALAYDAVQHHGWYANLDPTVQDILRLAPRLAVDYSGGTGILAGRLLRAAPASRMAVAQVDASAKFLRMALEKFRGDARVAFRHLPWLAGEGRLRRCDEAMGPLAGRVDLVACANAVHLYPDLPDVARSWRRTLRDGGRLLVQSGNVDRPDRPAGAWLIDGTVEAAQERARGLVAREARWAAYRPALEDAARLGLHDRLRQRVFLPLRPLATYVGALEQAGFDVVGVRHLPVAADVREWHAFLSVYHEAILGWVGGVQKVEGKAAPPAAAEDRKRLLLQSLQEVLGGPSFTAEWTYLEAVAS